MKSKPLRLELNQFIQVYVIPKKNPKEKINHKLDVQEVVDSYATFYQQLIINFGLTNYLGPTSLVLFDRFFDVGTALQLKLVDQLREFLLKNIKGNKDFYENLMSSKVNCINLSNYLDEFDYVDDLKSMPMEDSVSYLMLPVFVLSSNPDLISSDLILEQFRNPKMTDEQKKLICFNKIMEKVRHIAGEETQVSSGLLKNEKDVADYIVQQNKNLRKRIQEPK
jgi:hypothetical protein